MNHRRLLPWLFPAVSLGVWGFLVGAYTTRADAVALVTMAPVWCWLVPGVLLAGVRPKRRRVRVLWGLWLLFALVFVDELRPLYHPLRWLSAPKPSEKPLGVVRVVSLNCAGGDPKAAAEVSAWQPDVVLLQEIPNPAAVRALAKRLFGREEACVLGFDTAVLARELTAIALPRVLQRSVAACRYPLWPLRECAPQPQCPSARRHGTDPESALASCRAQRCPCGCCSNRGCSPGGRSQCPGGGWGALTTGNPWVLGCVAASGLRLGRYHRQRFPDPPDRPALAPWPDSPCPHRRTNPILRPPHGGLRFSRTHLVFSLGLKTTLPCSKGGLGWVQFASG